jgi:hypothetical protein
MTSRSGRGRWERVLAARQQARVALGREPGLGDLFSAPPKRATRPPPAPPPWGAERPAERPNESVLVLSLGEAAACLGVSRTELEAMIERGGVETLQGEFIRMVPTREVERLSHLQS